MFLIGYVFGPLLFSPLSEMYGRRIILIITFAGYTAFTLGCAMAPTWPALLIFRFLVGLCAAAPYTLGGGICADLYSNAAHRGLAIMVLMIVSLLSYCHYAMTDLFQVLNVGPASGPIIAGLVSPADWRRKYWVALILAGVSFIPLLFLPGTYNSPRLKQRIRLRQPETYGPVLHARRAGADRTWVGTSANPTPLVARKQSITKTLSLAIIRPFRMFSEPIVLATSLFLAMIYAVFYLFFEIYPIIFGGKEYHLPANLASLLIPLSFNS